MFESGEEIPDLEDFGLAREPIVREGFWGKARSIRSLNRYEFVFLITSLASVFGTAGLVIFKIIQVSENPQRSLEDTQDQLLAIVLLVNTVFCVYYVLYGIFWERPNEILLYVIALVIVWVYVLSNFISTRRFSDPLKLSRLVLLTVLGSPAFLLGLMIAAEYLKGGRFIFYTLGARDDLQRACKRLYQFEALLKLDIQVQLSLIIFILASNAGRTILAIILLSTAIILSFVWNLTGFIILRIEYQLITLLYFAFSVILPAYVIYFFTTDIQQLINKGEHVRIVAYSCSILALVLRPIILASAILVYRNFGLGLKYKLVPQWLQDALRWERQDYDYGEFTSQ